MRKLLSLRGSRPECIVSALAAAIVIGGAIMILAMGAPLRPRTDRSLAGVNEELCDVLYAASLAANSHNSQSWRLVLDTTARRLTLYADESRALNVVDPLRREMYLSLGCYIGSMLYAFDAYGYDARAVYTSEEKDAVAVISWHKREAAAPDRDKLAVILRRHTDKSAYRTTPLSAEAANALVCGDGAIRVLTRGSAEFDYLKTGTLEAVALQASESDYRRELNGWMRFSDRETLEKKDGVNAEMIGLRGIVKALYYLTTSHANAEGDAFARQGLDAARRQVENCGAYLVVTGEATPEGLLDAGRKTQALWYRCVENNIAVQPLSAMLEALPWREEIRERLGTEQAVQMILRAGYVDSYGENAAVRRDLGDYCTLAA